MKNIENLLKSAEQVEYRSPSDILEYIKQLECALKMVLNEQISMLKRSEVENDVSRAGQTTDNGIPLDLDTFPDRVTKSLVKFAQLWSPDIRWRVKCVYRNLSETNSGLSVDIVYKLEILTSIEDLQSQLKRVIDQGVEALMLSSLIRTSDRDVLKVMYDCFNDSEDVELRRFIECALKRNFYIELVEFVPGTQYADNTYFDVSEAVNVEKPVTTRRAVVSKKDNSCIIRGHYVVPKFNNYE